MGTNIEPIGVYQELELQETERTRQAKAAWNKIPSDMREEYGRVHSLCCTALDVYHPGDSLSDDEQILCADAIGFGFRSFLEWMCSTYGEARVDHCVDMLREIGWTTLDKKVSEIREHLGKVRKSAARIRSIRAAAEESARANRR